MPFSVLKYSSVNAKARALYGKLLTREDYENLLSKKTVHDVATYIKKNTAYSSLLIDINENQVHRGELEKLLKTSLYADFKKLLRFLGGSPGKFLQSAFLRYEIEDLKALLRVIYTGRNGEVIKDSLVFLRNYSDLDYETLIQSKNVADLVGNLKGSVYYKVLSPLVESKDRHNLFDIEMAVDLHFFMMMLKMKDKLLSGNDWKSVTRSFGIEIDIMNIMMIYRCKRLFNLSKEATLNHVIPHWYRLSRGQLVQLAESRDVQEFKDLILKTKYRSIFNVNEEHLWEANSLNYSYRMYKSHLRRDYFNIGTTMAYLHLKEMDIRNIITLIEGVRYSLPREETVSYLIGINK